MPSVSGKIECRGKKLSFVQGSKELYSPGTKSKKKPSKEMKMIEEVLKQSTKWKKHRIGKNFHKMLFSGTSAFEKTFSSTTLKNPKVEIAIKSRKRPLKNYCIGIFHFSKDAKMRDFSFTSAE